MSGLLFALFLGFALLCKCGISYYRALLLALLCQFVAFEFSSLDPLFCFFLQWGAPLLLMSVTTLQEEGLGIAAKGLFLLLAGFLSLFGIWDYRQVGEFQGSSSSLRPTASSLLPKAERSNLPLLNDPPESEKSGKEEEEAFGEHLLHPDLWEELLSREGEFRVLSPLPAVTREETKKIDHYEVRVTNTRIKDLHKGVYYVVLTTHYPSDFPLPSSQEQAQQALEHLIDLYKYPEKLELDTVQQDGIDGIGFHLKKKENQDHLLGLILPCDTTLYQVLVFTDGDLEGTSLAEKFLLSFQRLQTSPSDPPLDEKEKENSP